MKLVAQIGERREEIEVREGRASAYEVRVGERTYRVDAADLGAGVRSLRVDGAQHEVAVHPAPSGAAGAGSGRYRVSVSAVVPPYDVEVLDPLTDLARRSRGGGGGSGRRQVVAMMPGRVVAVLAGEGSEVETGDGVVVIEAMKMENEIAAEGSGVVKKVFVETGQTVEAGEPLFEVG
jgi:biotin carboxyl carrier protein